MMMMRAEWRMIGDVDRDAHLGQAQGMASHAMGFSGLRANRLLPLPGRSSSSPEWSGMVISVHIHQGRMNGGLVQG